MSDPTIAAIDKFFDVVDKTVDAADRVLNRGKRLEEAQSERRERRKVREVIDATPVETKVKKTAAQAPAQPAPARASVPASTSTAIARKPHFYIKEVIHPKTGATIYVVTDGRNARTDCGPNREFAEKILRALEKTP